MVTTPDPPSVAGTFDVPGLPDGLALSPSRASDFLTCPLLFRYRAIDRFPERPSSAAARGSLVHAVLEDLFDLPAAQRTLATAQQMLTPAWTQMMAADPKLTFAVAQQRSAVNGDVANEAENPPAVTADELVAWIKGAEPLLATYFNLEDPTRLQPEARELRIEVQLEDGPALRGIVDRIDMAPGDLMRVVDYKTGRAPGERFEQRAMFQMRFYGLMLWRLNGTIPKRLQLMYLGDAQVLHYDPTQEELEAFEKTLRALWDAITRVAETGDWQPKPSRLCNWCDHHDKCPAQGGVVPNLPVDLTLTTKPVT